MSAPLYLILTRIKNRLRLLVKSPAQLILLILFIALIGFTIWSGGTARGVMPERDIRELGAIAFALYLSLFMISAYGGLNKGGSIFTLPDVHFLFPAPVDTRRVLIYGLIQQIGTSVLVGVFLLFQYSWLHQLYGISYGVVLLILACYAVNIFCAQLTAMTVYAFSSHDKKRRKLFQGIFVLLIVYCMAVALFFLLPSQANPLSGLVDAAISLPLLCFPVAGWMAAVVLGVVTGSWGMVLAGVLACAGFVVLLVSLIVRGQPDFYEDVLGTAELSHAAATAKKEGTLVENAAGKVKLGKIGLSGGFGASAFFYKHRLEVRRTRLYFDGTTLLFLVMIIGFSFFMRNLGVVPVLTFATYTQVFTIALGRFTRELLKPYVFLVPEPPFRKMFYCLCTDFVRHVAEALIVFIPVSLILNLSPVEGALLVLTRISFSILFTAGNVLIERVFNWLTSKAFLLILYFVILIVLALPGIAVAILVHFLPLTLLSPTGLSLLALSACNLPVALLVLFLCRNMLEYAQMNNH